MINNQVLGHTCWC